MASPSYRFSVLGLLPLIALAFASCATPPGPQTAVAPPPPPPALQARLTGLGQGFDGIVGIAVKDLSAGWTAAYDGDRLYPQQSVSKLWPALTVFDAVDRGEFKLTDPITVRRDTDMSVFNQPIQKLLDADGLYQTTVDGILDLAISKSDNAADDILIRKVGGPPRVRGAVASRRLQGIRPGPEERELETTIAGVEWKPEYSFGEAFWEARDQVPLALRVFLLARYVVDPADGATPKGLVNALGRLHAGELLSPASTARYLALLDASTTGPMRLKAGLPEGWKIGHKTGTGQDLGELTTGYNDVGLITAPDGHAYAVAVMMAATSAPIPDRQKLMADVAAAIVVEHDLER